jgi:hypothetical protein
MAVLVSIIPAILNEWSDDLFGVTFKETMLATVLMRFLCLIVDFAVLELPLHDGARHEGVEVWRKSFGFDPEHKFQAECEGLVSFEHANISSGWSLGGLLAHHRQFDLLAEAVVLDDQYWTVSVVSSSDSATTIQIRISWQDFNLVGLHGR